VSTPAVNSAFPKIPVAINISPMYLS